MSFVDFSKHHSPSHPGIPEPIPGNPGHPHPFPGPGPHFTVERASMTADRVLWVVFALQLIATLSFFAIGVFKYSRAKRLFFNVTGLITLIAAISYYAMANHIGVHYVPSGHHMDVLRPVYYARYIDWLFTTPLLLLDMALFAGLAYSDIIMIIVADVLMVITGLIGGLNQNNNSKWGWFVMSCAFMLYIFYTLLIPSYDAATQRHARVGKAFLGIALYSVLLWSAYPIIWALSEGTQKINIDSEIYAFAFLDVTAKIAFGVLLLVAHEKIPESQVKLSDTFNENRTGRITLP